MIKQRAISITAKRLVVMALACCCVLAWADPKNLGEVAVRLRGNFLPIGKLMIATAYIAGIGFGIAAIYKFKQYRDNPTQIPIGTPFALMVVSVALVFLPGIMDPIGNSIFGNASRMGGFEGSGVHQCLPGGGC